MKLPTMILDLDDDGSIRLSSDTLGGARVGIRRGGQPERVVQVRHVYESETGQYARGLSDCDGIGAWNMLDFAREVTVETGRSPELAVLLSGFDELLPLISEARRRHSNVLAALQELEAAQAAAVAKRQEQSLVGPPSSADLHRGEARRWQALGAWRRSVTS